MPKGTRGGKRGNSQAAAVYATDQVRSDFVWNLAKQGINNPNKQNAINQFVNQYQMENYDDVLADVDSAATEITIASRRNMPVYYYGDKIPAGYTPVTGATTAPKGFMYYSNNQSRFSGNRKTILVAIPDYWRNTDIPF